MTDTLSALFSIFLQLSLLSFGGGVSILPEMQRQVVDVHGWMSASDFAALYALAQAAPGPNMMISPLIGWQVGGLWGMLLVAFAKFVPTSVVMAVVIGLWTRFKSKPWRMYVQVGLAPITVGLVASSAWLMSSHAANNGWQAFIIGVVAALSVWTRLHPLWLLFGGAALGLLLG